MISINLGRSVNMVLVSPGTHWAHSIPEWIDGHPGNGRCIASAITALLLTALWIRIHVKPAMEPRNSIPLNTAT